MIKTPTNSSKSGIGYTLNIKWTQKLFDDYNERLKRAIRGAAEYSKDIMNEYYVPRKTGSLINSSSLVERNNFSVDIVWNESYAASVYYNVEGELENSRGPHWFDRMITVYANRIAEEANKAYFR